MTFEDFYYGATGDTPFAWQRRLALAITQGDESRVAWPDVCALPTATGKSSLILIALYALAMHPKAHRRIAYVIDRRIVVDQAYRVAKDLQERLHDPVNHPDLVPFASLLRKRLALDETTPLLETHLLRGGLGEPLARLNSPLTPTILVGTVDQLGSRLLFRGYGVSERMRSIAAGLLSHDTLWILDEAHLSRAFADTLKSVGKSVANSGVPAVRPLHLIEVSATPRTSTGVVFKLGIPDDAIRPRLEACKTVTLVDAAPGKTADEITRLVVAALAHGKRRIGVIVNRVLLARDIFAKLEKPLAKVNAERLLLIGPIRAHDRDQLYSRESTLALSAKSTQDYSRPIVAVCTQTIEVGADLDFDALVVQAAPLDVLRQRFGRLDRIGKRPGADGAMVFEPDSNKPDFIYGTATADTATWLRTIATDRVVDFGINALEKQLDGLSRDALEGLCARSVQGEPLDTRHIRNLVRTSDAFADEPDVSIFLHGEPSGGDVQLVWRDDLVLPSSNLTACTQHISAAPPCSRETLMVSVAAARAFLANQQRKADVTDIDADLDDRAETARAKRGSFRPALRWSANPEQIAFIKDAREIRAGDTLIIPSTYGGADDFGWAPGETKRVADVSIEAYVKPARAIKNVDKARALRFRVAIVEGDGSSTLESRVDAALEAASSAAGTGLLSEIARFMTETGRRKRAIVQVEDYAWVTWRHSVDDDAAESDVDAASFTRQVLLVNHLRHVAGRAHSMARGCGLSVEIADRLARAGLLHDLGKADERFQIMLRGGDLVDAIDNEPLAKGLRRYKGRPANLAPYDSWPEAMRHEVLSVAMVRGEDALVRHLIGSHHGYGRPSFPSVNDSYPRLVSFAIGDDRFEVISSEQSDASLWEDQFESLVGSYGVWGLAYLEAILRLADHRCSQEEENGEADVA